MSSTITDSFTCNAYIESFSVTTFGSYIPRAHTKRAVMYVVDVCLLGDGNIGSNFFNYHKHTILSPFTVNKRMGHTSRQSEIVVAAAMWAIT
jgi:hypothetical protein